MMLSISSSSLRRTRSLGRVPRLGSLFHAFVLVAVLGTVFLIVRYCQMRLGVGELMEGRLFGSPPLGPQLISWEPLKRMQRLVLPTQAIGKLATQRASQHVKEAEELCSGTNRIIFRIMVLLEGDDEEEDGGGGGGGGLGEDEDGEDGGKKNERGQDKSKMKGDKMDENIKDENKPDDSKSDQYKKGESRMNQKKEKQGQDKILEKLCADLSKAEYHGCPVHLHLLLPGEMSPVLQNFTDHLYWKHGKTYRYSNSKNLHPNDFLIDVWQPSQDREFMILFDKVANRKVSPHFFTYSLAAIRQYILEADGSRKQSVHSHRLMGIGPSMPLGMVAQEKGEDRTWQVSDLEQSTQALVQLPGPTGTVYFPWFWRDLREYFKERHQQALPTSWELLTGEMRRHYDNDWSRILLEFQMVHGKFGLYPTQAKFVTASEADLVEQKGIQQLIANLKPLHYLQFYDFGAMPMLNILSSGQTAVDLAKEIYPEGPKQPSDPCLLDEFGPLPVRSMSRNPTRYMLYEPQGTLLQQIESFHLAFVMAAQLKRTLIVPPILITNVTDTQLQLHDLVSYNSSWTTMLNWDQFDPEMHPIPRSIMYRTPVMSYAATTRLRAPLKWLWRREGKGKRGPKAKGKGQLEGGINLNLWEKSVASTREITLLALQATDSELKRRLGACEDQVLSFRHFINIIETVQEEASAQRLLDLQTQTSKQIGKLLQNRLDKITAPKGGAGKDALLCVVYSRGKGATGCIHDAKKNKTNNPLHYYNCQASAERIIEYGIKNAAALKINITSVYYINEINKEITKGVQLPPTIAGVSSIHSRAGLARVLEAPPALPLKDHLVEIAEMELCYRADMFIGNIYSTTSTQIAARRTFYGLPSHHLGQFK